MRNGYLQFLLVISTCESGKARGERMLDALEVVIFPYGGRLTLWRCARRVCIASERFVLRKRASAPCTI